MKKLLLILSVLFIFILSACDILYDPDDQRMYSENEIQGLINDILDERELYYMDEEALTSLIITLIPSTLTEDQIINIVDQYIPHELTENELRTLIQSLLPEDRYTTTYDLGTLEEAITNMVKNYGNAIVGIANLSLEGGSTGSGVIYKVDFDAYDGVDNRYYVITNHHVVENFQALEVIYEKNGMLFNVPYEKVEFIGSDPTTDIAVLTFRSSETFPVIEFADSYEISVGQFVFAIGNPLGFEYFGTATMGIISGTSRFLNEPPFNSTVIQHDASLSPGNSGGALLDVNGNLIGINHMKIVESRATNIGFAVPSNTVQRIIADLEAYGTVVRPFLGITSSVIFSGCNQDFGTCVEEVIEGGAADAAGLQSGDVIIGYKTLDMDEFLEVRNFTDLREYILNSRVGDEVRLKYIRDGVEYISRLTILDTHPDDDSPLE